MVAEKRLAVQIVPRSMGVRADRSCNATTSEDLQAQVVEVRDGTPRLHGHESERQSIAGVRGPGAAARAAARALSSPDRGSTMPA
jgi:hypothetical protein